MSLIIRKVLIQITYIYSNSHLVVKLTIRSTILDVGKDRSTGTFNTLMMRASNGTAIVEINLAVTG